MSKNSTFVDMAIHGGTPFGSAGGAAPELRGERSGGIFWRDGRRAKRAPAGFDGACRPFSARSREQGRGSAAISSRFLDFLRTVMWLYCAGRCRPLHPPYLIIGLVCSCVCVVRDGLPTARPAGRGGRRGRRIAGIRRGRQNFCAVRGA